MEQPAIILNHGSTLRATVKWQDENGQAVNAANLSAEILPASNALIGKLSIEPDTDNAGDLLLMMNETNSTLLSPGGSYRFRLKFRRPNGDLETTKEITLQVH